MSVINFTERFRLEFTCLIMFGGVKIFVKIISLMRKYFKFFT